MADPAPLLEYAPRRPRVRTWHDRFAQCSVACAAVVIAAVLVDPTRRRVEQRLELLGWQRECLTFSDRRQQAATSAPPPATECWEQFCRASTCPPDPPIYLNQRRTSSARRLVALVRERPGCGSGPPVFSVRVYAPGTLFSRPRLTRSLTVDGYSLWTQDVFRRAFRLSVASDPVDPARFRMVLDTRDGQSLSVEGILRDDETVTFAPAPSVATSASGATTAPSLYAAKGEGATR